MYYDPYVNLRQTYRRFPSPASCVRELERLRWKDSPTCPYCGGAGSSPLLRECRHHCKLCNTTYSVLVGTVFHNSKLDLRKWFLGVSIVLRDKKPPSARELAKRLEISKNTAWLMITRVMRATPSERAMLLSIGDLI